MVNLIAVFQLRPGKEALFTRTMLEYSKFVQANDRGCIMYVPHIDVEHPSTVVLIEKWTDQASLDAHQKSSQMKEALSQFKQWTKGKTQIQLLKEME